jgi:ATP-dependent RNA helicase RhlB
VEPTNDNQPIHKKTPENNAIVLLDNRRICVKHRWEYAIPTILQPAFSDREIRVRQTIEKAFMKKIIQRVLDKFQGRSQAPPEKKPASRGKTAPRDKSAAGPDDKANPALKKSRPPSKKSNSKKGGRNQQRQPTEKSESAPPRKWDLAKFQVPTLEDKIRFHDFDLDARLMHAIHDLGFKYCTPIQAEILPSTLAGRDASGRAQTGTGKTAAFLITVITHMLKYPLDGKRPSGTPRVLVVAPTRELVLQITEEARQLAKYCRFKILSVFGGMNYETQKKQLTRGTVDVVVATPGRLLDFKRKGDLHLKKVEVLIIDEADRMLDMGFIPDVRKIIYSTPKKDRRQTLLFSATLTEEITRMAAQWTRDPVTVEIEPEQVAVDSVEQLVYIVTTSEKFALLFNLVTKQKMDRVLIFCNRRDEVRRLSSMLTRHGINCTELSGDVPQTKRIRRLEDFKNGRIQALVATDVAGRGIHIEGMDHVINYTLPRDPEDYVHRIGRTGRAGAVGTSVSFADEEDAFYLPPIEKFMGRELKCTQPEEEWLTKPVPVRTRKKRQRRSKRKAPSAAGRTRRPNPKRSRS